MSRSGYEICNDTDDLIRYQVTLEREIKCSRGQAFLRELLAALDAMPKKQLIKNSFSRRSGVCTLGAVFAARGVEPPESVLDDGAGSVAIAAAEALGIAEVIAGQLMFENDETGPPLEGPRGRWARMREWVERKIGG